MMYDGGYMGGMHGGWWVFWLLLVLGSALLYAWQRKDRQGKGPADTLHETPHEVLRRRLASGSITPQQYEEHKTLLDRDGQE
jgi:putative membrane protein